MSTAAGVEYHRRDDCPGEFFNCVPMAATITAARCASMWSQANARTRKPDPCDRLHRCQRCQVGAQHAGESVVVCSVLFGARMCSRCHTPSPRLIGGEHCPSCYNREREVLIGRNGKGTRPVKHAHLESRHLLVACDGVVSERHFARTADAIEPIVSVLRRARGVVLMAFSSSMMIAVGRPVQQEMRF